MRGNYKHGQRHTRLYNIWRSMRQRCNNPKTINYSRYGGRGIKVCQEWNKFIPFFEWSMSNGYDDALTLDRIDNTGNYEPSNCRWVTYKEQNNNRRDNAIIEYMGKKHSISEWADIIGISNTCLYERIRRRVPIYLALTIRYEREKKKNMMDSTGRITKEDAVKILTEQGYKAEIGDGGVVVIYVDIAKYLKEKDSKKYIRLMQSIGYDGSWSLKPDSLRE